MVRRKVGAELRLRWVRGGLGRWKWECEGLDQSKLEFKYSRQNSAHLLFAGWKKKERRAGSTCCWRWRIGKAKKTSELHLLWPVNRNETSRLTNRNMWHHITFRFVRSMKTLLLWSASNHFSDALFQLDMVVFSQHIYSYFRLYHVFMLLKNKNRQHETHVQAQLFAFCPAGTESTTS